MQIARTVALGTALVICCLGADRASAAPSQAATPSAHLTIPNSQTIPPARHSLSARQAIAIASSVGKVRRELGRHPGFRTRAYTKGPRIWQVSYFDGSTEVAQATVDERRRTTTEAWTGAQVAWQMARGIPGAFGRKVSAPYVWIPLMALFALGLADWRRPLRLEHLDLLILLGFSISQYFFNRGNINLSVPLVYPVLAYLLVRMLAIAYVRRLREPRCAWRPSLPTAYLALLVVFLVGFRVGLNIADSNVIDVGYSGVIGADRIEHGHSPYGRFPADDQSGNTYGPANYYAYVPLEAAFPWSGEWDGLPAAHAAAICFDLMVIGGLLLVGRRMRRGREGTALGVSLAYAWTAFPYTLYAMNSNANDSLVAALLTFTFLAAAAPRMRGVALAIASATKFAPLALAPLFASYDRRRLRDALLFALALTLTIAALALPLMPGGGPQVIWNDTIGYQLGRASPFSVWGQHPSLEWLQTVAKVLAGGLALLVALLPSRKSPVALAALGAAVLIALQITLTHWFYLYIVWWLPFVLIALLARGAVNRRLAPSGARSIPQGRSRESAPSSP